MNYPTRDDFPQHVKDTLARRVNHHCSNPECNAWTSGPQVDEEKAINVGVCAHITAAAGGGPRFDASLSPEERKAAKNGIWLCQNCAKLIDNDPQRYPGRLLREWKANAEARALSRVGKGWVLEHPVQRQLPRVSVAKLPTVGPLLIGRERELLQLDVAWHSPRIGVASLIALGGVGKTAIVVNWCQRRVTADAERVLAWSFYSQGAADDRQASAESFFDYALREWFGVTDLPFDSWTRGERLAECIRQERTLLVLDGLEPLQHPPGQLTGRLKDPGMVALLKELAAANPGLCVCTSRLPLTDLADYGNSGALGIDLENLSSAAGAEYLAALGVCGSEQDIEAASAEFGNHALALTLLGTYLVKRRGGHVHQRDTIPQLEAADLGRQGAHARRLFRHYEVMFAGQPELAVLRMLGLFDRPAERDALRVLREHTAELQKLSEDDWASTLEHLSDARLILNYTHPVRCVDCHPLIREHFEAEYRRASPEAFEECHSLLYAHYSAQAPHQPETLGAMTPLLYAVRHGCQAGKHVVTLHETYNERILRDRQFYLWKQLGAFATDLNLLAEFFAVVWNEPHPSLPSEEAAFVRSQAALALLAVGRLTESLELRQVAAEGYVREGSWLWAAISLRNLSQLQLSLGHVSAAIAAAKSSVDAADQTRDNNEQIIERTVLADALFQSGDIDLAETLFQEAERMQAEVRPDFPLLDSIQGHQYCELLVARGRFDDVANRVNEMLRHDKPHILAEALTHLSAARASAVHSDVHFGAAISGLRRSGLLTYVPLGLLARAQEYRLHKMHADAERDLDEVRALAVRCGMRLVLTDYHLEKARLSLSQSEVPAARQHLDAARRLVDESGYHRRDAELLWIGRELEAPG